MKVADAGNDNAGFDPVPEKGFTKEAKAEALEVSLI